MSLLSVQGLTVRYGPLEAVREVSFSLKEGEALTLIGPNGAGKTSVLRGLLGLAQAEGKVFLDGAEVRGRSPEALLSRGLVLVPEGRALFPGLSVEDNLLLGGFTRFRRRENLRPDLERVYTLFPRLLERRKQPAGTLSGGEQQMLAIGRALMARPRLLLLDEPSLGLAPLMVQEIYRILRELKGQGTTLLVVEQNAKVALALADRGLVLEAGEMVLEGPAEALRQDPRVVEAYLGLSREPDVAVAPSEHLEEGMGQAASQGEHLEDAFMRTLGLQIQHLAPGEAVVAGEVRAEHLNLHGTVHGGFLYALADSAFALASNSRGPAVALSCRMDYFRPLSAGARVEARAQEVNLSRRTATYRVEVVSEGKLVALFTGTVFRLGGDAFPGAGEGLSSGQNAWRKEEG